MSIVFSSVSFSFSPADEPIFKDVSFTIPERLVGLVGRNGSGKTTALRLIAGDLTPSSGSVSSTAHVEYLQQNIGANPQSTVAQLLGIDHKLDALRRIEEGSLNQRDYDVLGDDWDVASQAAALISRRIPTLNLDGVLERTAATLSGGELVKLGMAALEMAGANIILLDEPTNNLDRKSKLALIEELRAWEGQAVVVSHDVELLGEMDCIVEVHQGTIYTYGGNWDFYQDQREAFHEAALRNVASARSGLRSERRDFQHVQSATAKQAKHDKQRFKTVKGRPRLSDPTAKRSAQARRANRVKEAAAKVAQAKQALRESEDQVRDDESIQIPIVDPGVPRGRLLMALEFSEQTMPVGGGDRWAIIGDNGVGKTTLLRRAIAKASTTRVGYLDQRLALPSGTVFDAVASAAPHRLPHDTYELLAKFKLRGPVVERNVETLSGGERFRVALARILLADPPPEIIVLDEPTNNLDIDSVEQLVSALQQYKGAILIVSHDQVLLNQLNLARVIELHSNGSASF